MKFCYNTNFTLPKQSQRSSSVLQDGSRSFRLFWKEKKKLLSYNRRNTVQARLGTEPRLTDLLLTAHLSLAYIYYSISLRF